ncbi:MAG: hypothetical protein AB7E70_19670 [Hyphomicrobiaceae bacterium]
MKFRDLPAAQFGRYGETIVSKLLRNLGAGVIATFKFSGENDNEAPSIEFHEKRITLADLDVSMRGKTFSLEVKTYAAPEMNRTYGSLVHGIPVRLFDEYVSQENERGIPVHLGILEVSSGELLVSREPISSLVPRYPCLCGCRSADVSACKIRKDRRDNRYPQWYFRHDSFAKWHQLDAKELEQLQREHSKVAPTLTTSAHHRPKQYIFDDKPAWTWCCLACNATGIGEQSKPAHRCAPVEYMQSVWIKKLKFTFPTLSREQLIQIVNKPVDRQQLIEWWGWQWADWKCAQCRGTAVLASTPFDPSKPNNGRPADSAVVCQRCSQAEGTRA